MATRGLMMALGTAALVVGACSESGKISLGSADRATTTTQAAPAPGSPGQLDQAACKDLAFVMSTMAMAASGTPSPTDVNAKIDPVRAQLPGEMQEDFDIVIGTYRTLIASGGNVDDAATKVDTAEFKRASDRVAAYFENTCT